MKMHEADARGIFADHGLPVPPSRLVRSAAEAETAARRAVELTGRRDPAALAALADVLCRRRRFSEAMLWIKRAEAAAPEDARWGEERERIQHEAIWGE